MNNEPIPETANTATLEPVTSLAEGQKIAGCYILRKQLPNSVLEQVWLAQDEVLGKDVTLHFTPDAVLRDPRAIAELRAEVKRNRQLIHPSIVRLYDYVEDGALAAISTDKSEGETLREILRQRGSLELSEVLPWLKEIAETLDDANRVQLIHRDLSPENFCVRPGGGILIKGFGVSRVICDALERAGLAKGDAAHLSYVSPQLFDGEKPSPSDDVYGFGVLVFELLTGAPPFTGENLVGQIRKAAPPTLSQALAAAGKSGTVPASWQEAVAGCLAKTPEQRPRNCAEVVKRLSQDTGGAQPVAAEEPKRTEAAQPVLKPVTPAAETPKQESMTKGTGQLPPEPPVPAIKRPLPKPALSQNFPDLDRPKSKLPIIGLGIAAVALGFAVVSKFMQEPEQPVDPAIDQFVPGEPAVIPIETLTSKDYQPLPAPEPKGTPVEFVNKPISDPGVAIASTDGSATPPVEPPPRTIGTDGNPSAPAKSKLIGAPPSGSLPADPKPADSKPADSKPADPKPPVRPETEKPPVEPPKPASTAAAMPLPPLPELPPKLVIPKDATEAQIDRLIVERKAAYDKLRAISAVIEVANEENAALRTRKKAEMDEASKALAEKRKVLAPIIQQAAAAEAERKKLAEAKAKSEAAAVEAAKAADAAKKAHEDFLASASDKLGAKEKTEAELREADAKALAAKKIQDELGEIVTKGTSQLQQLQLALHRADEDQKALKGAYDAARGAAATKMAAANKAKIAVIDEKVKSLEAQRARYAAALVALKDLPEMADSAKKMEAKIAEAEAQIAELKNQIKDLSGGVIPPAPAKGSAAPSDTLPKKPDSAATSPAPPETTPPAAAPANSLGMEFVQLGDVAIAKNVVTRTQFEAFSKAAGLKPERWRNPGFEQGASHPVVNVSWREADEFCKWLTGRERKEGKLKADELYRLPTDLEWSKAVGLPEESGTTPDERDMRIENVYPWGTQWPPAPGSGNYAGEETETELPIRGYNDGFPNTSPVGSFKPNTLGLFDMSGNVWQWVQDNWDAKGAEKTLRGGSWYNGAIPMSLLSSCRIKSSPETIHDTYGFRIVKAKAAGKGRN